jgi:hypothetical protein
MVSVVVTSISAPHAATPMPMIRPSKTDMGPSGMAEMFGKVTGTPSDQPGLYCFLIETGMAGKWELILTAKVQGEAGRVTGKITYDTK